MILEHPWKPFILRGMEQADWALAISMLSALLAGGSVFYTRRLAVNDTRRMRRKRLVVEITSAPSNSYDGWHEGRMVVRNLEPIAACITGLRVRRRGIKLLPEHAALDPGSKEWNRTLLPRLPEAEAAARISLLESVAPVGTERSRDGNYPGATVNVRFYASQSVGPTDLVLEWNWADGERS